MIITIFDTETDSLVSNSLRRLEKQPRIIEFFALSLCQIGEEADAKFEEVATYGSLLAYPGKLLEEVTKITSITQD